MVFHADLDEFMMLVDPEGGNLADMQLAGCMKNVSQALFRLYDTGANECGHNTEMDCFNPGASHLLSTPKSMQLCGFLALPVRLQHAVSYGMGCIAQCSIMEAQSWHSAAFAGRLLTM